MRHLLMFSLLVLFTTSTVFGEVPPAVPDVAFAPHETHYGAYHVPGNLLVEGTSFESGDSDALDGGWYWKERRFYTRWIAAGDTATYLTTNEPPQVVYLPSTSAGITHGDRCLELRMTNRSVPYVLSRPFTVATSGTYTLSLALLGDPAVPENQRPWVNMHLRKWPQGNLMANNGPRPTDNWSRQSISMVADTVADPGQWYQVALYMGAWDPSIDYVDQSVWIDAVIVQAGSATDYDHPSDGWQLGARVYRWGPVIETARVPYDTYWVGEDEGFRRLAVDIYPAGTVADLPVTLTVDLYDSQGSPGDIATRLATHSQTVDPGTSMATVTVNLDTLLAAAGDQPGFYLAQSTLTDGLGATVDRQQTPFLVLHRAPETIPDPELSPFGCHPHAISSPLQNNKYDLWYGYGLEVNAPVNGMLTQLRDMGIRWTREFVLFDYIVSAYYADGADPEGWNWEMPTWPMPDSVPPVFTEYVELLDDLGMETTGVFWTQTFLGDTHLIFQDYVTTMVRDYGALGVDAAELFNEPNHGDHFMDETVYADWVRATRLLIDQEDPLFRLAGPATTFGDSTYINDVLADEDGGHYAYDDLDLVTYHRYLKGNDSFPWNLLTDQGLQTRVHRAPEDVFFASGPGSWEQSAEWEMKLMGGKTVHQILPDRPPVQRPDALGGGKAEQEVWDSEWGPWLPLARDDQPFIDATNGAVQFYGGMSGSLRLGRRMSARSVRQYLCSLEHGTKRLFVWDSVKGHAGFGWRWFEGDKTPTVMPAAMTQMTRMLEGYDLADVVTVAELPDNGVNTYYTRAQFYLERVPDIPGDPRAVAVLWNWADDQFDHLPGSGITDTEDPAPDPGDTLVPALPIDPALVTVSDLEGRMINFTGAEITDLLLDHEPRYIKTLPGTTPGNLMLALDSMRPPAPSKPIPLYDPATGIVSINTLFGGSGDISGYLLYREDLSTGELVLINEGMTLPLEDTPPPGHFVWYLVAVEEFTGYETAMSPPSDPLLIPTIDAGLTCVPTAGTLPFDLGLGVTIDNRYDGQTRRAAGMINVTLANGSSISSWRAGYTNIVPLGSFQTNFNVTLPAYGTLAGDNLFQLEVEDVTPTPYNQPPYPPAGSTASESCTVTGVPPMAE